ncbi:hypothetical protein [Pseudomonas putida]|uniref:Uncharacterized protein n=1 Tax=Pseudomonas putida TaxID=303 RepID=A0A6I6Y791_PSEPU|nr:hypothetical protein [Pseudomonas putida]QHG68074.1 hypothetical protein C2H86_28145 [Pseudomonas putida]
MEWLTKLFEGADWGARIPAYAGLLLSVWALWRGRTVVKVRLGNDPRDSTVVISNLSPHAIEITAVGLVEADGSLTRWAEDLGLNEEMPKRVDARSELVLQLDLDMTIRLAYEQKARGRGGCYVRVAGGRIYADPGRFQRWWWRALG